MSPSIFRRPTIRLCAIDGNVLGEHNGLCGEQSKTDLFSLGRSKNIYTAYVEKTGALPSPATAITIGKLLGVAVKADDGNEYPEPSKSAKLADKQFRRYKKSYHLSVKRADSLEQAFACLAEAGDPKSLAIHMKKQQQVGEALDVALEWLNRFAEEWHSCEQSCY